jgi:hypothetical protein
MEGQGPTNKSQGLYSEATLSDKRFLGPGGAGHSTRPTKLGRAGDLSEKKTRIESVKISGINNLGSFDPRLIRVKY